MPYALRVCVQSSRCVDIPLECHPKRMKPTAAAAAREAEGRPKRTRTDNHRQPESDSTMCDVINLLLPSLYVFTLRPASFVRPHPHSHLLLLLISSSGNIAILLDAHTSPSSVRPACTHAHTHTHTHTLSHLVASTGVNTDNSRTTDQSQMTLPFFHKILAISTQQTYEQTAHDSSINSN